VEKSEKLHPTLFGWMKSYFCSALVTLSDILTEPSSLPPNGIHYFAWLLDFSNKWLSCPPEESDT